ncbi:dihydrofolate reductase family protein [Actinoplanes friuliensis]|uniref:Bifunctional pyrimidine deaminase/reductase-like protein n=1 Tax=Actinoplanes friuliensis DSM 7358 TaxID=1246995 RepID=U5VY12_9ACTN|nr:dihydrofolate reductase family protein [Actinoplanes friuliensis]AGZ41888.1 bifunctional pyrimidine deaminase/reductase-like protein [Actinoplanes friuliensis DSM 7358]
MRRIVVTQNITLDGIVDNARCWFDPTADTPQNRELQQVTAEHSAASDGFLVGRVTFEEMRGFWPQLQDDRTGVTDHLNRVAKYVVSRTMNDPGWSGTTVLRGGTELAGEITALKAQDGTDIVLTGSITLAQDLFRNELVDEVRLFVYPVLLGEGRRLFPEGYSPPELTLVESRTFSAGCVLLRYTL